MELIRFENLSLRYGNRVLFKDLNFSIYEGDYFCIAGENGSGKTTLMNAILGMKEPAEGKITISNDIKTGIGYLPQQKSLQKDFPASVYEVVISGFQKKRGFRPFYNNKEKEIADNNMKRLGILDIKKQSFGELSGGQQQRVLISRALCATDKIILLDEPVTGLDKETTEEMYKIINELNDAGVTIVMISHDASATIRYASRVLHLGNKVFIGTNEDYKKYIRGDKQ